MKNQNDHSEFTEEMNLTEWLDAFGKAAHGTSAFIRQYGTDAYGEVDATYYTPFGDRRWFIPRDKCTMHPEEALKALGGYRPKPADPDRGTKDVPYRGADWKPSPPLPDTLEWAWAQPGFGESSNLFDSAQEALSDAQENANPVKGCVWVYSQTERADTEDLSPWVESMRYVWNCDGKLVL